MTNNQTKEESLARWVAEKLDIRREYTPHHWDVEKGSTLWHVPSLDTASNNRMVWVAGIGNYWCSAREMLSDKNVAGRLLEYVTKIYGDGKPFPVEGAAFYILVRDFCGEVMFDTPAAIEVLAKACGWVWSDTVTKGSVR